MLYIKCSSPAETWITFSDVVAKCFVTYQENLIDRTIDDLMSDLPYQFYFAEAYDASRKAFVEPPCKAQSMGRLGKVRLLQSFMPFHFKPFDGF